MRKALLFLVLALALVGAGCGGSSSADGCTDVDVPPAREDGGQTAPTERLDPEKSQRENEEKQGFAHRWILPRLTYAGSTL